MNNFVAAECGGANPLMKLKNKVKSANHFQDELVGKRQVNMVPIQQSFDMQKLLEEVNDIPEIQKPVMQQTNQHQDNTLRSWQQEFSANQMMDASLERTIQPLFHQQNTGYMTMLQRPQYMNHATFQQNYNSDFQQMHGPHDMIKTGYEILKSMEDKVLSDVQVEELNQKIKGTEKDSALEWVEEYEKKEEDAIDDTEHLKTQELTEDDVAYWDKLQNEWNELFRKKEHQIKFYNVTFSRKKILHKALTLKISQEQFMNDEEFALGNYSSKEEYEFDEANPFHNSHQPFEQGLKKLQEGDLISAILLFEEAVRVNPDHAEAWQYLGTSQAENEQETLAIAALKKCLELQSDNLNARMALAVSYTNESLQVQACNSLKEWIEHNPRYSHLKPVSTSESSNHSISSFMSPSLFKEVESLYLAAARISPKGDIDADIQVALGVIFNLSGDYDKAIDCFQTGLQARPDSADIWNKMGATYANSGRSTDAVEAYRNALHLRPGFIRCRYNLGISCINMKAYSEAAEHFISALNMQRQGGDRSRAANTMSENIWTTLRMTISMLGRLDLLKIVDKRDLTTLKNQFDSSHVS